MLENYIISNYLTQGGAVEVGPNGCSDAWEVLLKLLKGVGREGCRDQHKAGGSRGGRLQGRHLLCKHALCAPSTACSTGHLSDTFHGISPHKVCEDALCISDNACITFQF